MWLVGGLVERLCWWIGALQIVSAVLCVREMLSCVSEHDWMCESAVCVRARVCLYDAVCVCV